MISENGLLILTGYLHVSKNRAAEPLLGLHCSPARVTASLLSPSSLMSLITLPPEIILVVISLLPSYQVELFAQTFNRIIYEICKPLLATRIAARRNERTMIRKFGERQHRLPFRDLMKWYEFAGLEKTHGPFKYDPHPNDPPNLEYLDLNGDLHWLQPVDPKTLEQSSRHYYGPAAATREGQVEELVVIADRLGIILPKAFIEFFLDEELQWDIPRGGSFFKLGGAFHKYGRSLDGSASGYVVKIYMGTSGGPALCLYLSPGDEKGHCVIDVPSWIDWDSDSDSDDSVVFGDSGGEADGDNDDDELFGQATEEPGEGGVESSASPKSSTQGEQEEGEATLIATTFEEFLVMLYFNEWCAYCYQGQREFSDAQKEYVANLANALLVDCD